MSDREIFLNAPENATPEALAQYLEEACAGDVELRVRVEALFAAGSNMETEFLGDAVPGGHHGGEHDTVFESPYAEEEGTVIGRYKLLQKIGEGGMGDVWMAEQREPIARKVALKVVKAGMDTKEVLVRFEAERQALALMNHPHIAQVLDAGATRAGRPYFVMELVQGVPITEYCDQRKLSTRERLELFVQVCEAIQHAHQKGVIHRDIKPSNVMVTNHDGSPHAKVIDFGVAKATSQRLTEKTLFTRYGQMVGTPAYMSPEQAEFTNEDVDTRSDIYSLGCLLYELLTGAPPFDPTRLRSMAFDELCRVIREDEPQRPSTRISTLGREKLAAVASLHDIDDRQLSKKMRGELDWIAMQALEKNRDRRYQSARDFAQDIGRALADEPVSAAGASSGYRLRKFVRRQKADIGAVAAIIACSVASLVAVAYDIDPAVQGELALGDKLTDNRGGGTVDERLALVGIDKASLNVRDVLEQEMVASSPVLKEMSFGYPFPRSVYAALTEKLISAGARLVVFDMIFTGERQGDAEFKAVLDAHPGKFVIGASLSSRSVSVPKDTSTSRQTIDPAFASEAEELGQLPGRTEKRIEIVQMIDLPSESIVGQIDPQDPRIGLVNFYTDLDNNVRSALGVEAMIGDRSGGLYNYLTFAALKQLGESPLHGNPERPNYFKFPVWPHSKSGSASDPIPLYSIFLPDKWEHEYSNGEVFRDKIVYVGGTSVDDFHDIFSQPGGLNRGVRAQMSVMSAALNGNFYEVFSKGSQLCSILAAALLALWISIIMKRRPLIGIVILVASSVAYLLLVRWVYLSFDFLLPSFMPLITLVVASVLCLGCHVISIRFHSLGKRL